MKVDAEGKGENFVITEKVWLSMLEDLTEAKERAEREKEETRKALTSMLEDVEEARKKVEEEKNKTIVELEKLSKAKDQFILTTQHHLRTPLTIIKGYIEALLNMSAEMTLSAAKKSLTKANEAINRLDSLINEFLDIAQLQVGENIIKEQTINLQILISQITAELSPEIEKRNLKLNTNLHQNSILQADFQKLKEALTNLIDNAVKYNNEGGEIRIKGERDKSIYRLTIEDTGIGIPSEELSQLFTQYFERGKEAQKVYTTGRGIGLMVTKNIIEAHGGRIYAESEGREKGSKFIVELPLA